MSTPPKQETRFCLTPESTGLGMSAKPPQCSTPTSLSAPSLLASRCPLSAPPPAPVPVPGAGGCAAPQRRAILVGETPATSRTALACDDVARLPQRGQCTHRAHDDGLRGVASTAALPTEHYRVQLERCRRDAERNGCDAAKINGQMNDIFLKRLKDIDDCASGNNDLRLITYQEWVDMLLHINVVLISNMEDLEAEVQERLQLAESRLPCQCRTNSAGSELAKARKDICSLLKVIQNGYHNDNWNLQGMHFETVTHAQVLGKMCMQPDNSRLQAGLEADTAHNTQYNKLMVNMKALAIEVADKHDELREMKKQVLCLEDEIQNAQKKIQLKDDVIKELRNDLKQLNTQNAAPSSSETASVSVCESDMKPPANCEAELSSGLVTPTHSSTLSTCNKVAVFQAAVTDMTTPFESLANNEQLEKQKLRELETELTQLFAMSKGKEMLSLNEAHRKSFLDIFQRSESEKAMAYRKLDYIRRQLVDLETNSISHNGNSEADGAMSVVSMKAENDQDAKILESLRKRISKLNESTFGLKKQVQELEIEKNVLSTDLQTERKFSERNQATLREVADLLCGMSGEQFSYKDIYSDQSKANPFCETILKLRENFDRLLEKDGANLMQKEEKIKDLEQVLCGFKCELQQCEAYKFQICQLRETIVEKEQQIIELNAVLKHLQLDTRNGIECCSGTMVHRTRSDQELAELRLRVDQSNQKIEKLLSDLKHCHQQECFLLAETRKLNDELMDSKRKNSELTTQARRIGALLESQEDHRMELAQKYEALEGNFDDQAKKLRAANSQLNFLQDKFTSVEKRHDEYILENKLLRDEVISLKEKEATLIGKQKSLLDQAMKTENELYKAHDVINEQHNVLQRNQQAYEETVERMQESFADMKRQYNQLLCDYKELETEYDKQKSCMQQSEKLIESFRKWKEAQIQADDATRTSFRQYEEHIQQLLEQKQDFLSKYRKLYGDFTVLQTELDRLKTTQTRGAAIPDNIQSENSEVYQQISKRMELIRRTSRRVTEQCSAMHSEVALKDLPAAPSKSS